MRGEVHGRAARGGVFFAAASGVLPSALDRRGSGIGRPVGAGVWSRGASRHRRGRTISSSIHSFFVHMKPQLEKITVSLMKRIPPVTAGPGSRAREKPSHVAVAVTRSLVSPSRRSGGRFPHSSLSILLALMARATSGPFVRLRKRVSMPRTQGHVWYAMRRHSAGR